MASYRQILYHIIFGTYDDQKTLSLEHNRQLFAYILGIISNNNCFLYRINGMEDHIHILCDLHPTVALASLIRDMKASSSLWLKKNPNFPNFRGWAAGYGAFTYAYRDKDMIVNYIKNQQQHHMKVSFKQELIDFLQEHGVGVDWRFFP